MSNIYTFGVPWVRSNSSSSALWNLTATATAMTSTTAVHPIDEALWELRSRVEKLIVNRKLIGVYNTSQLDLVWKNKAKHQRFKLPMSDLLVKDFERNDSRTLDMTAGNVVSKLELIRDQTDTDIYVHSLTLQDIGGTFGREIVVEIYLLGDITVSHDIYLNPVSGEVEFNEGHE